MPFCHVRIIVPTYKIHDLDRFSSTGQSQKGNNSVNMSGLTMSSALVCISDMMLAGLITWLICVILEQCISLCLIVDAKRHTGNVDIQSNVNIQKL